MTDLKFESCTALSSSSPVIEASKLVTGEVESRVSDAFEAPPSSVDCVRTILTTFYHLM